MPLEKNKCHAATTGRVVAMSTCNLWLLHTAQHSLHQQINSISNLLISHGLTEGWQLYVMCLCLCWH
jgi:hypothetical protein